MDVNIINTKNEVTGKIKLPAQFDEPLREDLIKRAVVAIEANQRQRYGAKPEAGKRSSAYVSKRRNSFKTTYGIGQSRTPRKVMSARGTRFNWVGAFAPQTVGGRRSHPAKASKAWTQKINTKERLKAIRSALGATMQKIIVETRGHKIPDNFPFILSNDVEKLGKTKDVKAFMTTIGLGKELERSAITKIRAGIGKMRGRKTKSKTSALFVTTNDCPLLQTTRNLPGVDAVTVEKLNTQLLAPGTAPGRLTLYTQGAIETLGKKKLYTTDRVKEVKA
ncbi:50S ribosomal protein L4 [Candidatus Woesearchaeota archaeon]|nr:50S ribosomal protein L4 [Candidatus Woesearchaeota archaeon]